MGNSLSVWRRVLRPWPVAVASSVLLFGLLASLAWHWAEQQAYRQETQRLQVLQGELVRRNTLFFEQLHGHLQELASLQLSRCDAPARQQLRLLRRSLLYAKAVAVRLADDRWCESLPLPVQTTDYQHWRFGEVELLWQPDWLNDPLQPSLLLQSPRHRVASSLYFVQEKIDLAPGYQALLADRDTRRVLDFAAQRNTLDAAEWAVLHHPQQLQALDGRLYLASAGDAQGIQLLLIADATALQASLAGLRLGYVLLAGVLAVLGGALAGLLMRRELSLEKALQQALRRGELEVDYQPLVDLATRRCVGAEALVRWRRADGQRVRPDLFIPQAEASGQICAITQRVIELVMQQMAELLRAHPTLYISVNLAAADIAQGRFVEVARQQLASQGVAARQLVWEVTERGLVDVEQACQLLGQLRQAGHRIAIDDFGTGYSSLSYLQRLPVDVLKIDKSFVDSLGMQAASSSVAPHIIDMARDLGLKVIAEGIESATQADTLQQLGAQVG